MGLRALGRAGFLICLLIVISSVTQLNAATVVPQTGWWWNPNEAGRGFFIEQQGGGIFMTSFLYADNSQATWVLSTNAISGNTYSGSIDTYCCGQTLTGPYHPNSPNGSVGNITITFSDSQHGTLTWPGGTISIQRFSFTSSPTPIAAQPGAPQSGWWWNPNESGRGFAIEFQGNGTFIGGFMYNTDGTPIWYLSTGAMQTPTSYQGNWNQYCCGQTLAGAYKPNSLVGSVGSLAIQFTSPTTGVMTLPDGRQINIQRFIFAGPPPSNTAGLSSLNHIIFRIQENRSFDHYFAKLNDYRVAHGFPADVDTLPAGETNPRVPDYAPVGSFHLQTMCIENTSAAWYVSHQDFNLFNISSNTPTMDGYVWSAAAAASFEGGSDTAGVRAMGYYDANDLPYYYFMATQFALSDRWYSPGPFETEPSKIYMVAATSAGHAHKPASSLNIPNIFWLLDAAHLSWKVYYERSASDAIVNYIQPYASQHQANIVPISQYFTDVQNGTLPNVAMIEPGFGWQDEHPGVGNSLQLGAADVAQMINALMNSVSWKDSVFILTYDEAGSMYDHVPPPTNVPNPDGIQPVDLFTAAQNGYDDPPGDFTRYGFRVPNLVISPFTKRAYVSHVVTDSTAVLKLIETRFGLPNLTRRDAFASDMTDFFDFQNVPWATPPAPPVQPTNGPCYDGLP
jgi:phospholipase C